MTFFVAGAIVAGTAYSAHEAGKAADKASDASGAALDEQRRQFDLVRDDTKIARETGNDALLQLGYLLGVRQAPSPESVANLEKKLADAKALKQQSATAGPARTPQTIGEAVEFKKSGTINGVRPAQSVDTGAIDKQISNLQDKLASAKKMQGIAQQYPGGLGDFLKNQPGYQFGLDQGNAAVTNNLTAGGQSQGGKALKAAERFGIDYAGSKTGEHLNNLFTLAGYGPAGVNTSANAGQNLANGAAGHAQTVGDAAFGEAGANIGMVNNALNTGLSLYTYNDYMNRTHPRTTTPPTPGAP